MDPVTWRSEPWLLASQAALLLSQLPKPQVNGVAPGTRSWEGGRTQEEAVSLALVSFIVGLLL